MNGRMVRVGDGEQTRVFCSFFYIKSCKLRGRTVRCYLRPKDNIPVAPFRENSPYKGGKIPPFSAQRSTVANATLTFSLSGNPPKVANATKTAIAAG